MTSVASAGTAERIVARILLKVVRPGSGTLAMYSSTSFGPTLAFALERLLPDFAFFILGRLSRTAKIGCATYPRLVISFGLSIKPGRLCELARRQNFHRKWTGPSRPCS